MKDISNEAIWTKPFFIALINNFLVFIVFYSLMTVLPVFAVDRLERTETEAGLMTTMFLVSAIIMRPFAGKIIEALGKKRTLVISVFFFSISTVLYLVATDFTSLLFLRLFHGIWFSLTTTVLMVIAADIVPDHRKGEGLGYFAMSMNVAVVAGPFLALGLLSFIDYIELFGVLAAAIFLAFGASFFVKKEESSAVTVDWKIKWSDLLELRAMPIAVIGFLTSFAYASIMSFITIYANALDLFDYVGLFFVVFAVVMIVSRPFTGRLFDSGGPDYVIYPSLFLFAAGLILLSFVQSAVLLLIAAALIGLGYGALLPAYQTLAIQSAPKSRTSHATSTFFIMYDLGIATGSVVLGIVSSALGFGGLYITAGIVILAAIMLYRFLRTKKRAGLYTVQAKSRESSS
ncbi:hypothetical protein KP77_11930 [Jeotgalibacillus alimentarius]|uniref:Major facilitator superfamily (MFS) profile domain-containing protein n=1 Tax=Jeotgalibacillus alimentarius TaxID=135826 RepID=A0A0C2W520_9BACL|nr:MFS transporter [Jeotgalibacillus alimentarius]KIL51681.1 hypothetical protein KP77_11930 [Jeotgalibacillus alimentarius]